MKRQDIYSLVCGIILSLAIIGLIALSACVYNENAAKENAIYEQVKLGALRDLDLPEDTECNLTFTGHWEEIEWSDYYIYIYTLRVGDRVYLVGAQRKDWELHGVDVEGEITEQEAEEWEKIS